MAKGEKARSSKRGPAKRRGARGWGKASSIIKKPTSRKGRAHPMPSRKRTKAPKVEAPDKQREKDVINLRLFPNIQFIYELVLAKLELDSFGIEHKMREDMHSFDATRLPDLKRVLKRSAYIAAAKGEVSDYSVITKRNQTRSVNQFLTHWIYPYKGKFHPQLVRALLNIMGMERGEVVLDPFIGSGTTAVEAKLLGINCIGLDVSKVCVMVSRAKTLSVDEIDKIDKEKDVVLEYARGTTLFTFNRPQRPLKTVIKGVRDLKARNFFQVGELVAHSASSRRKRSFMESFIKNVEKMALSSRDFSEVLKELKIGYAYSDIREADARKIPLEDDSVDGILTSPPYSIALDYVKNDKHAHEALGLNIEKIREHFIGVRGRQKDKISLYNRDMGNAYSEMYRVLKPGKFCTIVIGNATVQKEEIPTVANTISLCKNLGFELVHDVEKIIFGLYNIMQKENILIFKKV